MPNWLMCPQHSSQKSLRNASRVASVASARTSRCSQYGPCPSTTTCKMGVACPVPCPAGACNAAWRCMQVRRCLVMVPLLYVLWQKVQVPVDVFLGMACPSLMPDATALTQHGRVCAPPPSRADHYPHRFSKVISGKYLT